MTPGPSWLYTIGPIWLLFTKMGETVHRVGLGGSVVKFGHVQFKMSIRDRNGNVEQAVMK